MVHKTAARRVRLEYLIPRQRDQVLIFASACTREISVYKPDAQQRVYIQIQSTVRARFYVVQAMMGYFHYDNVTILVENPQQISIQQDTSTLQGPQQTENYLKQTESVQTECRNVRMGVITKIEDVTCDSTLISPLYGITQLSVLVVVVGFDFCWLQVLTSL